MAVGRGSMERAAKAAGTDAARKSAGNKEQTSARRMTISEIVGETSAVEPPAAARRPADKAVGNKIGAVRYAEKNSEANTAEEKPVEESKAPEVEKAVEESKVPETEKAVEESKVPETEKAIEKGEIPEEEKPVAGSETPVEEKPVEESKAPAEENAEAVVTEEEAPGQIIYQKSSGMLERAAEPNERFGLGDAMPVYYF